MRWSSVLKGGLLAGLVINLGEVALHALGEATPWSQVVSSMGLQQSGAELAYYVLGGFGVGVLGVWLYAAARERLGAGPGTAATVGLVVWALAWLWPSAGLMLTGTFPAGTIAAAAAGELIAVVVALVLCGWGYAEHAP